MTGHVLQPEVQGATHAHLHIRELKVGFEIFKGFVEVLDVDELVIHPGEALGLVGESAAGKTVLALTILGLLRQPPARVQAQELSLCGESLLHRNQRELRKTVQGSRVAMVFQDPMSALNPVLNTGQQLTRVIQLRQSSSHRTARAEALKLMRLVELPDPEMMLSKYPHQLSGGQRQRVIIALALACEAELLVLDEPTRNLDVTVQASVLKTLARLHHELGVSLLFIANNLGLVSAMCDRVAILLKGRIVEMGAVRDVIRKPLHPYTTALLHAVPRKEERVEDQMEGVVLEADYSPSGCRYYPRCKLRSPGCEVEVAPRLTAVSATHAVACPRAVAVRSVSTEAHLSGEAADIADLTPSVKRFMQEMKDG